MTRLRGGPSVELVFGDKLSLRSSLAVGADGFLSRVRELGGFELLGWDYDQTALVANLNIGVVGRNETAWQRFLPGGPIALLPVGRIVGLDRLIDDDVSFSYPKISRLSSGPYRNALRRCSHEQLTLTSRRP